jgi:hypothetical protein
MEKYDMVIYNLYYALCARGMRRTREAHDAFHARKASCIKIPRARLPRHRPFVTIAHYFAEHLQNDFMQVYNQNGSTGFQISVRETRGETCPLLLLLLLLLFRSNASSVTYGCCSSFS